MSPPSDKPGEPVASKDVIVDADTRVWARLYLLADNQWGHGNLSLIIYFHGGGFMIGSPTWSIYHAFMCILACEINSVIISVGYRLAPEHRLPMAYDDCFSAVEWVCQQAAGIMSLQTQNPKDPEESWMTTYCDFLWCFLSGDSAGGNITHHFAMRAMKTNVKPPSTKC